MDGTNASELSLVNGKFDESVSIAILDERVDEMFTDPK